MDIKKLRKERLEKFDRAIAGALAKKEKPSGKNEEGQKQGEERQKQGEERQKQGTPVQVSANINPQDYIQIPKTRYIIAKEQTDNGLQYEPTHIQVLQRGLEIPTPYLFTTHLLNVIKAKNGKTQLCDGLGNTLGNGEVEQVYSKLTSNCWILLNAGFKKVRDENPDEPWKAYDLEEVTGLDSNGNLIKKISALEQCLMEDCFINLNDNQFNKQGLATKSSSAKNYQQGKVIRFYYPRDNRVARFGAYSNGASLGCSRDPGNSNDSLGVFGVCEANAAR